MVNLCFYLELFRWERKLSTHSSLIIIVRMSFSRYCTALTLQICHSDVLHCMLRVHAFMWAKCLWTVHNQCRGAAITIDVPCTQQRYLNKYSTQFNTNLYRIQRRIE